MDKRSEMRGWSEGDERMTRDELLREFKRLTEQMYSITLVKNNDYGSTEDPLANFSEFGELGFLVRMSDKWKRIKTALYEKRELAVANETVEDTLLDLANYCVLLLCWRSAQDEHCEAYASDETMAGVRPWTDAEIEALNKSN
jgi:hypothetical protein